jgi:transcriptional regulator with XRE-family HTH domain
MTGSNRDLRGRGYPPADIELAQRQREAEARAGVTVRSLAEVLAGKPARPRPDAAPTDLTARQLRVRGRYGQAALLTDQEALTEKCAVRTSKAREASRILKELARQPAQMEFSFLMGGNVSTGHQFHDAIIDRLKATGAPSSEQRTALATLGLIIRWLGWQTYACEKTAAELADLLGMDVGDMARTLALLETVGAIARVKRGRTKTITVTPEGAYRGDINKHAAAVDRYKAEVVPLRRAKAKDPLPWQDPAA